MESMRNQYFWEQCFTERWIIVGRNKAKEIAKKKCPQAFWMGFLRSKHSYESH